MKKLHY